MLQVIIIGTEKNGNKLVDYKVMTKRDQNWRHADLVIKVIRAWDGETNAKELSEKAQAIAREATMILFLSPA